jgi:hypothetical protein
MSDAGGVITSQVDLLWSVALALLLFELYFIARFLDRDGALQGGWLSSVLAGGSIFLLIVSMSCGYLTYGAVVTLARCSPNENGEVDTWCTENAITQASAFSDAELVAFLQFGGFGLALLLFIILFVKEPRTVAAAFRKD